MRTSVHRGLARRNRPQPPHITALVRRVSRRHVGPSQFGFSVTTRHCPVEAWRRVAAVAEHRVPLTTGRGPDPNRLVEGDRLVARTAVGPIGFDDVMVVRTAVRGERLVLEKVGRVLQGTVDVRFTPDGGGARVEWRQRVVFPWLPPGFRMAGSALGAFVLRPGYRAVVGRLLA